MAAGGGGGQEGRAAALYGGQEITHPDIVAAFNKEFPFIKVISATGRAADLMTRILAERRADRYLADVMASGPNGPRMLYLGKALDPIAPTFILPEVIDGSNWYGDKHWYADPENQHIFMFEGTINSTGLSYNTKLMSPGDIKSIWDLLAPKWKGKLLGMDPRSSAPPTPVLICITARMSDQNSCGDCTKKPRSRFSAIEPRERIGWQAGSSRCVSSAAILTKPQSRDFPWKTLRRTN